jgi:hypothetical protein
VFSGSGISGPVFRDVQDRIDELADVLKAGIGVEASAGRVADEELGADADGPMRNSSTDCQEQQRFLAWQKVEVGKR